MGVSGFIKFSPGNATHCDDDTACDGNLVSLMLDILPVVS